MLIFLRLQQPLTHVSEAVGKALSFIEKKVNFSQDEVQLIVNIVDSRLSHCQFSNNSLFSHIFAAYQT